MRTKKGWQPLAIKTGAPKKAPYGDPATDPAPPKPESRESYGKPRRY